MQNFALKLIGTCFSANFTFDTKFGNKQIKYDKLYFSLMANFILRDIQIHYRNFSN